MRSVLRAPPSAEASSTRTASTARASSSIRSRELGEPSGVAVDAFGRLYVADRARHRLVRFDAAAMQLPDGARLKVPHMGWNRVRQEAPHPLWAGVPDAAYFYFVHSFYVVPGQPALSVGRTDHGISFTCAVARDNIFATQFHPEKSAAHGLALYRNFLLWKP